MSHNALAVTDLAFSYGARTALGGISFEVPPGRVTALLGPNGAGKSTLFALLTRLLISPQGQIVVDGHDLAHAPRKALAALGVVFQEQTLDLDLSVQQNLRYFARLQGIAPALAETRIQQELERLSLWDRRGEKTRALNGGHRRRVEIARALIHRPRLLILDEPTVGLDPPTRRALVDHVHALCAQTDMAVLWATHLIDEVGPADRLVILHKGEIRACGDVADVIALSGQSDVAGAFTHFTTSPSLGPPPSQAFATGDSR